jgi:hypothetical protein
MSWLAVERLKWGDGHVEPGEVVPDEPGRDYSGLERHGLIVQVAEGSQGDDGAVLAEVKAALTVAVARAESAEAALARAGDDEVEVPDGVVPGETPGWPLGVFVVPLTDEQRAELAEAGISGTLTHEDLVGLLTPAGDPREAPPVEVPVEVGGIADYDSLTMATVLPQITAENAAEIKAHEESREKPRKGVLDACDKALAA